jgi:sarcosine oxidase subunit beta
MGLFRNRTYLTSREPKRSYDVVVIGAGGHGLATAYYLARQHGIRNVGVFERSYLGSGGTGRNTSILRANYKTPETIAFYQKSFDLYQGLSRELDFNLLVSPRGLLWLAHSDASVRDQRERALMNQHFGVDTVFLDPRQTQAECPLIDMSGGGHHPVLGSAYHPPGSLIRHDAVAWGFASAGLRLGVDIHQGVEVTGITRSNGRCVGIVTPAGPVAAGAVVCAVGGYVTTVASLAGVRLPIVTQPLQAYVTEPYKPVLDRIVASADLLVYISQSARGELLVGAEIERYTTYSTRSTYSFLSSASARVLDILPFMAKLRILRQWTGVCDMSPDYSPLMGRTELDGFYLTSGWGTWGFKAVPAGGVAMAELVATGKVPSLIAPFALDRFREDRSIPERSSAGTH